MKTMAHYIYSRYQQERPLPHYLRVAVSYEQTARKALEYYLDWLEGDGSHDFGKLRGTARNFPIVETRRHLYFKRNNVLTFVRK